MTVTHTVTVFMLQLDALILLETSALYKLFTYLLTYLLATHVVSRFATVMRTSWVLSY